MMKLLFCNFDEHWHSDIIYMLGRKMHADSIISVSSVNHFINNSDLEYTWINSVSLNFHNYDEYENLDLPAIDYTLLEKMTWCESLYYPLLDRSELVLSRKFSYQERNNFYHKDIRILLYLLEDVDACIFSSIPHVGFDFVLYGLCKALNIPYVIKYFCPTIPGVSATMYFMDDIFNHIPKLSGIDYLNIGDVELSPRMQAFIDYYDKPKDEIVQIVSAKDLTGFKTVNNRRIISMIVQRYQDGLLKATVKRRISDYIYKKSIEMYYASHCTKPDYNALYIYYPLHYQPECTSLPMGGFYYNQLLVIQQLAKHVPDNIKIYVRPHPNRSWFANTDFYNEVLKCRNVKLISPFESAYDLMDNAVAVCSLTGTSILESVVRGKPVLMFGYYIWQYAPGVYHCKSNEDVAKAIYDIVHYQSSVNRNALRAFLAELDKFIVDGSSSELIQKTNFLSQEDCVDAIVDGYFLFLKNKGLNI